MLALHAWDGPCGLAEASRLCLTLSRQAFEDARVPLPRTATPLPMPPPRSFAKAATAAKWATLPVLQVGDDMLTDEGTILRFVGKMGKLLPEDSLASARVEQVVGEVTACAMVVEQACEGLAADGRRSVCAKLMVPQSALYTRLKALSERMLASPSGFVVGDALSVADLACFCEFAAMGSERWYQGFPPQFMQHFPGIQAHRAQVSALPAVEAYYKGISMSNPAYDSFLESGTAVEEVGRAPCDDRLFLATVDPMPAAFKRHSLGSKACVVSKATYAANDPSEDRSTVALGDGFAFAGVWDGHGGYAASTYAETQVFAHFKAGLDVGDDVASQPSVQAAFETAYLNTDRGYLAENGSDPMALFAGTCAVAAYVDLARSTVCVSNLGDSRAVIGSYDSGTLQTVHMSEDHTASSAREQELLKTSHPRDPTVLVKMSEEDDDWRVKAICAFTRSIGDMQLKDKAAATMYNTYSTLKIMPRPGVKAKGEKHRTKPYIQNVAEYRQDTLHDGFILVACDGVWDEMSSDEAVHIAATLIAQHGDDPSKDVAEMFIEEVLKKAVSRIQQSIPEEEDITLAELKGRPVGKKDMLHRSMLHDDITVVILRMHSGSESGERNQKKVTAQMLASIGKEHSEHAVERATARELFNSIDADGNGTLDRREISMLATRMGKTLTSAELDEAMTTMDTDRNNSVDFDEFLKWWTTRRQRTAKRGASVFDSAIDAVLQTVQDGAGDSERDRTNEQIMRLSRAFEGLRAQQLRILFDALDADGNGTLDRFETKKLVEQVLGEEVTDSLVSAAFEEMDSDRSNAVDFDEFVTFFGL